MDVKEKIIEELQTLPVYIPQSGGKQHVVRCPYCGDSHDLSHGHFSIRIDTSDPNDPLLYRCFKCENSGLFTLETLHDLGLGYDKEISSSLTKLIYRSCKVNKITALKTEEYSIFQPNLNRDLTLEKIRYLQNRLGAEITIDDLMKFSCVINADEFYIANKIPVKDPNYIKFLTQNYIGFLSKNKNCITFRCIRDTNSKMKRYVKEKLNEKNLDPNTYFSIPNSINILYTNDINIRIAEGTFDILSVFYNLNHCNLENNFYYANCGFGYQTVLRNVIKMGLNTGINLHIYADNDKSDKSILKQIDDCQPWLKTITFHRNGRPSEKDFGVPLSRIIDTTVRYK